MILKNEQIDFTVIDEESNSFNSGNINTDNTDKVVAVIQDGYSTTSDVASPEAEGFEYIPSGIGAIGEALEQNLINPFSQSHFEFNGDGTKVIFLSDIYFGIYTLDIPYDLDSYQHKGEVQLINYKDDLGKILNYFTFEKNGTELWAISRSAYSYLYKFTLSTPYDMNTLTYTTSYDCYNGLYNKDRSNAFQFSDDGLILFLNDMDAYLRSYSLETPYDPSTIISYDASLNIGYTYRQFRFTNNGSTLLFNDANNMICWDLSIPYNIGSTITKHTTKLYVGAIDKFTIHENRLMLINRTSDTDRIIQFDFVYNEDLFLDITMDNSIITIIQSPIINSSKMCYNNDGTKLFLPSIYSKEIISISLKEPYIIGDINSYTMLESNNDGRFEIPELLSDGIESIRFNNDGTKLIILKNYSLQSINLVNPYDISEYSYTGESFTLPTTFYSFTFNPTGSKIQLYKSQLYKSQSIYEYNLSSSFDIQTMFNQNIIPIPKPIDGTISIRDAEFSVDGTKIYLNSTNYCINQIDLEIPFDVTTFKLTNSKVIFNGTNGIVANTYHKMLFSGNQNLLTLRDNYNFQQIPLDNSNPLIDPKFINEVSLSNQSYGSEFIGCNTDGTVIYSWDRSSLKPLYQYSLETPYDISSTNHHEKIDIVTLLNKAHMDTFGANKYHNTYTWVTSQLIKDGTEFIITCLCYKTSTVFELTQAYDFTTIKLKDCYYLDNPLIIGTPMGCLFSEDGTIMYCNVSETLYQYFLETPFDLRTVTSSIKNIIKLDSYIISSREDYQKIYFNSNKDTLYILNPGKDSIAELNLIEGGVPGNITDYEYNLSHIRTNGFDSYLLNLIFIDNGSKILVNFAGKKQLTIMELSEPYNLIDLKNAEELYTGKKFSNLTSFSFSTDGLKYFTYSKDSGWLFQNNLGTPFDVDSIITHESVNLFDTIKSIHNFNPNYTTFYLNIDGSILYGYDAYSKITIEVPLLVNWDISTLDFDNIKIKENNDIPGGIYLHITFSEDGLNCYGYYDGVIYDMVLTKANDLSSFVSYTSFDADTLSPDVNISYGNFLGYNADKSKYYFIDSSDETFYEFILKDNSEPGILENYIYNIGIDMSDTFYNIYYATFCNSGSLLVTLNSSTEIKVFDLSNPYDISYLDNFKNRYIGPQFGGNVNCIKMSPDGLNLFVSDRYNRMIIYNLDTPFDVTSFKSYTEKTYDSLYSDLNYKFNENRTILHINEAGTLLKLLDTIGNKTIDIHLIDAWNLDNLTYSTLKDTIQLNTGARDGHFSDDGYKFFYSKTNSFITNELSTPYDLSTITSSTSFAWSHSGTFKFKNTIEGNFLYVYNGSVVNVLNTENTILTKYKLKLDGILYNFDDYERVYSTSLTQSLENDTNNYNLFDFIDSGNKIIFGLNNIRKFTTIDLEKPYELSLIDHESELKSSRYNSEFNVGGYFCFEFYDNGNTFISLQGYKHLSKMTLDTPYDISTMNSYDRIAINDIDSSLTNNFKKMRMKPDGTKLILLSTDNNIYEFNLTEAYNLNTLVLVGFIECTPLGFGTCNDFEFKPDGSKIFLIETSGNHIHEYNLTQNWDITSLSEKVSDVVVSSYGISTIDGGRFNSTGTIFYAFDYPNTNRLHLSQAYDFTSTITYDNILDEAYFGTYDGCIVGNVVYGTSRGSNITVTDFNEDGYDMNDWDNRPTVQYTYPLPDLSVQTRELLFSDDGTMMFFTNDSHPDRICKVVLPIPGDTTSWQRSVDNYTLIDVPFCNGNDNKIIKSMSYHDNGNKILILNNNEKFVQMFHLTTPYDISTITDSLNNTLSSVNYDNVKAIADTTTGEDMQLIFDQIDTSKVFKFSKYGNNSKQNEEDIYNTTANYFTADTDFILIWTKDEIQLKIFEGSLNFLLNDNEIILDENNEVFLAAGWHIITRKPGFNVTLKCSSQHIMRKFDNLNKVISHVVISPDGLYSYLKVDGSEYFCNLNLTEDNFQYVVPEYENINPAYTMEKTLVYINNLQFLDNNTLTFNGVNNNIHISQSTGLDKRHISDYKSSNSFNVTGILDSGRIMKTHSIIGNDLVIIDNASNIYQTGLSTIKLDNNFNPMDRNKLTTNDTKHGVANPGVIIWNNDNTFVYIYDRNDNYFYEFDASIPGDINSIKYNFNRVFIPGYDIDNVFFSADGLKLFLTNSYSYIEVTEYNLATSYDIMSIDINPVFELLNSDVGFNNTDCSYFDKDGLYYYVFSSTDDAHRIKLNQPWDLSSYELDPDYTYTNKFNNWFSEAVDCVELNNTGTKILFSVGDEISSFDLEIPFDLKTVIRDTRIDINLKPYINTSDIYGLRWSSDGLQLYITTNNKNIISLEVEQPYTINSMSLKTTIVNLSEFVTGSTPIFNEDGTIAYTYSRSFTLLKKYNLNVPYDISSAIYEYGSDITLTHNILSAEFGANGTKLFCIYYNRCIYEYNLTNPYDISSIDLEVFKTVYLYTITNLIYSSMESFSITKDGNTLIVADGNYDYIYEFSMSTPWDINTLSYISREDYILPFRDFTFNSDDTRLIASCTDGKIYDFLLDTPGSVLNGYKNYISHEISEIYNTDYTFNITLGNPNEFGQFTEFYISHYGYGEIFQFILKTPDTLNSFNTNNTDNVLSTDADSNGYFDGVYNNDGTKLFVLNYDSRGYTIDRYNLEIPYDIKTLTHDYIWMNIPYYGSGITFSDDGLHLAISCRNYSVYHYTMITPFDIENADLQSEGTIPTTYGSGYFAKFSKDGLSYISYDETDREIVQYKLPIAWDMTNLVYVNRVTNIISSTTRTYTIGFSNDGKIAYIPDNYMRLQEFKLEEPYKFFNDDGILNYTKTGKFIKMSENTYIYLILFNEDSTEVSIFDVRGVYTYKTKDFNFQDLVYITHFSGQTNYGTINLDEFNNFQIIDKETELPISYTKADRMMLLDTYEHLDRSGYPSYAEHFCALQPQVNVTVSELEIAPINQYDFKITNISENNLPQQELLVDCLIETNSIEFVLTGKLFKFGDNYRIMENNVLIDTSRFNKISKHNNLDLISNYRFNDVDNTYASGLVPIREKIVENTLSEIKYTRVDNNLTKSFKYLEVELPINCFNFDILNKDINDLDLSNVTVLNKVLPKDVAEDLIIDDTFTNTL